ncbi:MAG: NeuD/PglB/VioB family sugar acetyltransferase [Vicinamibacterales bacterium]
MRDLVFAGGGGHATALLDCVGPEWRVVGYVAPEPGALSRHGVPYLGGDDAIENLLARGVRHAALGVAGNRDNARRREVFEQWTRAGFTFVDLVHPRAIVSPRARHGGGLQALAGAIVNGGTRLGANVIVNTGAVVEHDCELGDHVHVAPGATLCGGVAVGAGALVGAGAVVIPGIRIGAGAVVAAGAVVTRDVEDGARVGGVPARALGGRGGEAT